MDRAWLGGIRILLILFVGIATLFSGWKARRARHEKTIARDYVLLFVSGVILTTGILGTVFWAVSRGFWWSTSEGYLMLFALLVLGSGLAYLSNRILGRKVRRK